MKIEIGYEQLFCIIIEADNYMNVCQFFSIINQILCSDSLLT